MEQWLLIAGWLVAGFIATFAGMRLRRYRRLLREQERVIAQLLPRPEPLRPMSLFRDRPPAAARRRHGDCEVIALAAWRDAQREPRPNWPICQ
ncbi:MAG: hypothetical protein ACK4K7_05495 [Allosphingosinicella sp.]|uniref:hypothetical protein n=1 Tax=Allosphingosinicella sp. TaxID=2823234 RepID=UPI003938A69F